MSYRVVSTLVISGVGSLLAFVPGRAHALPPIVAFTSPTTIDEGREVTVDVTVTDPEGSPVTWSWDTDNDGVFGELPGATSYTVPATATDGPTNLRIGVQASDGTETRTVIRTIRVNNLPPTISTHPLTTGAVRREYRYEIGATDPGGANDPLQYLLTAAPTGMTIDGSIITWTPTVDQRGRTFSVILRVADGDGAQADQTWTIAIAQNTNPSAPTPASPIERANVAEGEPLTLVIENGVDPDGDPMVYFFRLSRSSQFDGDVIGSGEVAEQSGETTSWTTDDPLEPGLWYWQVWASDGIAETSVRYAQVIVGTGAIPDAGRPDAGPRIDAGPETRGPTPGRRGCSVAAGESGAGAGWMGALVLVLGALSLRRARRRMPGVGATLLGAALIVSGCTTNDMGEEDASVIVGDDADADGISDEHEDAIGRVDTDEDGVPDYLDTDSDDDGILDFIEAGDANLGTAPIDSDTDGTPDFRDTDSDANGIPDANEAPGDLDLDGIANAADPDDDDDLVRDQLELGTLFHPPADSDADEAPNFQDPDSDDDDIIDGDEFGLDTDRDGLFDHEDGDSDNDGIPDATESGDQDLYSAPIDTDEDGVADFRDTDSDNDGLSDASELDRGTDPTSEDSDRDGVTDLIEVGAGSDPTDGTVSPLTRGDFVFVVPFEEPPTPERDTLRFRTTLQLVDVYFLFDISGSMAGEIEALRSAVSTLMGDLTCASDGTPCMSDGDCAAGQACSVERVCIEDPSLSACVASPWTGGGIYEAELENLLSLQNDPARTSTALNVATFGGTESLYRAVWGLADPTGASGSPTGCSPPTSGRVGCPAFRADAQKILVVFTDEDSDGTETAAQAGAALRYADITTIGVWTGSTSDAGRNDLIDLARASDSLSGTGQPLVFNGMDAAVVPAVSSAINEVVEGVPVRVTIEMTDEPDDAGDALQFIDYLEINTTNPECSSVGPLEDTNDDGHPDAFPSLLPGTPVCWDVVPLQNDVVEPTAEPLVYRARLTVYAQGSPVDSRIIYFLVPPVIPPPDIPI